MHSAWDHTWIHNFHAYSQQILCQNQHIQDHIGCHFQMNISWHFQGTMDFKNNFNSIHISLKNLFLTPFSNFLYFHALDHNTKEHGLFSFIVSTSLGRWFSFSSKPRNECNSPVIIIWIKFFIKSTSSLFLHLDDILIPIGYRLFQVFNMGEETSLVRSPIHRK